MLWSVVKLCNTLNESLRPAEHFFFRNAWVVVSRGFHSCHVALKALVYQTDLSTSYKGHVFPRVSSGYPRDGTRKKTPRICFCRACTAYLAGRPAGLTTLCVACFSLSKSGNVSNWLLLSYKQTFCTFGTLQNGNLERKRCICIHTRILLFLIT